jgi:hypothetical protein
MAFAKRTYFYRPACSKEVLRTGRQVNEAKQKYQNLPQLFFWTVIIPLVVLFHLQPGKTSA